MQYSFSEAYQYALLRRVISDPSFLANYADTIQPEYFEMPEARALSALALQYYEKYRRGPTLDGIRELIRDAAREQGVPEQQLLDGVERARQAPADEDEDVLSRTIAFAQRRAGELATLEAARLLAAGRMEEIPALFQNALMIGASRRNLGLFYFDTPPDTMEAVVAARRPTGLPQLDEVLAGGIGSGELGIVGAPTYVGKTTLLTNIAVAALRQGLHVVEYCLDSTEAPVRRLRYDTVILGWNAGKDTMEQFQRELAEWQGRYQCKLCIKSFPHSMAVIEDFYSHLKTLIGMRLIDPAKLVVIIDYGLIMRDRTKKKSDRNDEVQREKYLGMIRLASDFNCPCWSAIQTKRNTREKKVIHLDDMSEVYSVAGDAHIILMLSQTQQDIDRAGLQPVVQARLHVAKAKNRRGNVTLHLEMDRATGRITERPLAPAILTEDESEAESDDKPGPKKAWKPQRRRS